MTLKRQLLIASLLMLLIPWAGLQFVLDLDNALREQAIHQLNNQVARMATEARPALAGIPTVPGGHPVLYAQPVTYPMRMDGYADEWPGYEEEESTSLSGRKAEWHALTDGRHLFLLIRVPHGQPRYYDPGAPARPYEHLVLQQQRNDQFEEWEIRTSGPGAVTGLDPGQDWREDYRVTGGWQGVAGGYQVELRLPMPPAGSQLGLRIFSPRAGELTANPPAHGAYQVSEPLPTGQPLLVSRITGLERHLAGQLTGGQQATVIESSGWVRGRAARAAEEPVPEFDLLSPLQIVEQIALNGLRQLVRWHQPEPAVMPDRASRMATADLPREGLVRHTGGGDFLLVSQPLAEGRLLVLEQSLDQLLTLSGNTLGRVISRSTLLVIGLMLVLLGYASWLSWRITRLQRAVNASVDDDGRIIAAMPKVRGRDELADLGRHFAQMVDRVQGYNRYLESFSRRLSHELKTPVAVVRSSLENLGHATSEVDRNNYINRASRATDRLSQILQGMSEAARLEQSFDHAEKETFDLAEVVAQATAAYQQLDPGHRIRYQGPDHGCPCHGSPELIVQLLDKLVDNARDFTPAGARIETRLSAAAGRGAPTWELAVFNEGSSLPEHLASEIFSPFVSIRDTGADGHLGQGLLIVRLIAEHHGGQVSASNVAGGVVFRVTLPGTI